MSRFDKKVIQEINCLGLDMMFSKKNGDVSNLLSSGNILYSLYAEELNYKNDVPNWINRDRLVVAYDINEAIYSALHLSGFDISLEDLEKYGKIGSNLKKYPSLNIPGVDAFGGTFKSIGWAVGIAYSERYLENYIKKINSKSKLINFNTYLLCNAHDLMQGSAYEALSFAGTQSLNKLIVIASLNSNMKDSSFECAFDEDIEERLEAMNFNVSFIKNSDNIDKICETIEIAKKGKKPTIILINNKINKYSNSISEEEVTNIKMKYNHSLDSFDYNEKVIKSYRNNIEERTNKVYRKWLREYEVSRAYNNSKINAFLDLLENNIFNIEFDYTNFKINDNYYEELSVSNEKILNIVANKTPFFLGGSLDLAAFNKTKINKSDMNTKTSPLERNIPFGLRASSMGDILNGMASLNLKVFGNANLEEVGNLVQSIKISAVNNMPVTYILSNDMYEIANEEELSPTYELSSLRIIPNLLVFRPADINEVIGTYEFLLKNRWTAVISLSNYKADKYRNTNAKYVKYGAYMVRRETSSLDGVIVSSGADLAKALEIANELYQEGIDLRVVSMPCMELFLKQNPKYEEQLLPNTSKVFVLESTENLLGNRFATNKDCVFGLSEYVGSGSKEEIKHDLGLDKETIKRKIKENL